MCFCRGHGATALEKNLRSCKNTLHLNILASSLRLNTSAASGPKNLRTSLPTVLRSSPNPSIPGPGSCASQASWSSERPSCESFYPCQAHPRSNHHPNNTTQTKDNHSQREPSQSSYPQPVQRVRRQPAYEQLV